VNLPGYPFARVRHWVDTLDGAAPVVDQSTPEQSARAGIVPGVPKIAPRIVSSNAADIASRLICEILARQLDCHPDSLAADRTLLELGVVSSGIASLVREINAELDLDLSPSALFEYPTIARLADHLQQTAPDALRRHRGTSAETVAATDLVAKALPDDVVYAPDVDPALAQKVLWTESAPDAEEYERLTF
jgi:acyl carrier protein